MINNETHYTCYSYMYSKLKPISFNDTIKRCIWPTYDVNKTVNNIIPNDLRLNNNVLIHVMYNLYLIELTVHIITLCNSIQLTDN